MAGQGRPGPLLDRHPRRRHANARPPEGGGAPREEGAPRGGEAKAGGEAKPAQKKPAGKFDDMEDDIPF